MLESFDQHFIHSPGETKDLLKSCNWFFHNYNSSATDMSYLANGLITADHLAKIIKNPQAPILQSRVGPL